jgi:pyridoxal 5'-phosphate synthase pdxS subunit
MDFNLNEDQLMFQESAREFAEKRLFPIAEEMDAKGEMPEELIKETAELGRLPVVNFAAGGLATPADAAMMMQLGLDGVFVGSGIFKSDDPAPRAHAIVQAVTHFNDPQILAEVSTNLGEAMVGINIDTLTDAEKMAHRGW